MSTTDTTHRPRRGRVRDEDIEQARHEVERAFALLGLVAEDAWVCPSCGTSTKGKVVLRPAKGYWKCHRCGSFGSPIKLLCESGWDFVDAVNALLGRPVAVPAKAGAPVRDLPAVAPEFVATVDPEVYDTVCALGDVDAAVAYWARWHIAPEAVREAGSAVVVDHRRFRDRLLARFGRDRLIACGLVKPAGVDGAGEDRWLCNESYPVIESHRQPDGHAVGLQFRGSVRQLERAARHKTAKATWERAAARYEAKWGRPYPKPKPRFVPKMLGLRGAGPESLIGMGLVRVARLQRPGEIYVVEGFKDLLAARTMGAEAYALPGAGTLPPEPVGRLLARRGHRVAICLDADDAGDTGAARIAQWCAERGIPWRRKALPAGCDVADVLAARVAAGEPVRRP